MHVRGQSTGVHVTGEGPKRLPKYWFESRRRYFAKNGYGYAAAADLAFFLGNSIGALKRAIKGDKTGTPHLLRDFVRESNRGRHVWFVADEADLERRLSA
jgi:hypothetical protein